MDEKGSLSTGKRIELVEVKWKSVMQKGWKHLGAGRGGGTIWITEKPLIPPITRIALHYLPMAKCSTFGRSDLNDK